jgi:hypothetical protein
METLKTAVEWISKLESLPAGLLTIVACIALGYVLKLVPEVPNKRIPLANFIFGSVLYMLLAPYESANSLIVNEGVPITARIRAFVIGLILSAAAWVIHAQVLKRIEDSDLLARLSPGLSNLLASAKTNPPADPPPPEPPKAP